MKIRIPDNLSESELVGMLRDTYPLAPAKFFPLGAFWIACIVLVAGYFVYRMVFPKGRKFAERYLALREFKKIENAFKKSGNSGDAVIRLANLMRRVGVVAYGYEAVAQLHSSSWTGFILEHDKGGKMTLETARTLAQAPYAAENLIAAADVKSLYAQAYEWSLAQL